jgi:hypothetical protein
VPGSTVLRARKYGRIMPYFTTICGKNVPGGMVLIPSGERMVLTENVPGSTVLFPALTD